MTSSRRMPARIASRIAIAPLLVLLAAVAGCGGATAPSNEPLSPQPLVTPTYTATEEAFAANLNPLSGLPSDSSDVAERRPRAIAVESWGGGSHPAGLQASEIVVEVRMPGTGGLIAVSSEPPDTRPDIGPLRSAAWPDLAVARAFGAELVAADAPEAVADAIRAAEIPHVLLMAGQTVESARPPEGVAPALGWAYTDAPVASGQKIDEVVLPAVAPGAGVVTTSADTQGNTADPGAADAANNADEADADEAVVTGDTSATDAVTWRHDPVLGLWRRLRGDEPEVDAASGEGIVTANLVLLAADGEPDAADWWVGTGRAALLRDGSLTEAEWVREGPADPLLLRGSAGETAQLRPGNTWIVVLPSVDLDRSFREGR